MATEKARIFFFLWIRFSLKAGLRIIRLFLSWDILFPLLELNKII